MIRKLRLEDVEEMFNCMCDDSVTHFMNLTKDGLTLAKCIKFVEDSNNSFNKKDYHYAIENEHGKWVGTISLKNVDLLSQSAEYAIITKSDVHGKGYAYIATKEILSFAFNDLKLNRIYLNVLAENERANAFYKKVGFVFEGCFRDGIFLKGELHNLNWYSFLKKDYFNESI